ncbi:MAG TPA: Hpt domain-containing protein [Longimicrobiaceae bacterium]|nr:Hpt domain-containing protein [Longimicrobiaceae bacterium]
MGDPEAFVRLRKWGGERLVREMVRVFVAQVPERVAAVRQGLRRSEPAAVEGAAHALKSSSAQLGAPGMRALCAEIESLAARGDLSPVPALAEELEGEFSRYLEWLPTVVKGAEAPA